MSYLESPGGNNEHQGHGQILFFISGLRGGGKERRLAELLVYLKQHTSYELRVIVMKREIQYEYVYSLGIPITVMPRRLFKKDPTIFVRFWREARNSSPCLLHCWDEMTTFYAIPAAVMLRIPIIDSEISSATRREKRSVFSKVVWRLNRWFAARIVSNSRAGLAAYGVKAVDGLVIHNGVRLERFQGLSSPDEVRGQYGITTPYAVVMVAEFATRKDHRKFVQLARQITERRSDVTFIAVGDGPTRVDVMEDVATNGLQRLIFTGKLKAVEPLVNACDVGILLSHDTHGEGIPNVVVEYMALGKPVIATDSGGTKEIVEDDRTGFLVAPGNDLGEIETRLLELLDSDELRMQMGERGRQRIAEEFSIERMGREFVNLYREFI